LGINVNFAIKKLEKRKLEEKIKATKAIAGEVPGRSDWGRGTPTEKRRGG